MRFQLSEVRLTKQLATLEDQITVLRVRLATLYRRRSRQLDDLEGLLAALLGTRAACREMLDKLKQGERLA
jgi:hypothetical protein